jgi:rod shape determining protein RodA
VWARLTSPDGVARRADWWLVLAALTLSVVGAVLAWAATWNALNVTGGNPRFFLERHLVNTAIGLAMAAATAAFTYPMLRAYLPVGFLLALAGMVTVLSPLGATINGAHSWIVLPGGLSLQPVEFAKVGLIGILALWFAEALARRDTPQGVPESRHVLVALGLAAVPLALTMAQPDLGSALILGVTTVGALAVAGVSWRWLVGLFAAVGAAAAVVLRSGLLSDYQIDRFVAFVNPQADPTGAGFNAQQSRIAIGNGGLTGQGLFEGYQTNGHFVPYQWTDFIFTVAGEELGFIGAGAIIGVFALLFWRIYRIALDAADLFGRVAAAGVLTWFAFQTFENIGMTVGIMPVTGVPLPFVSYGGSSMFAGWIAIGLLENVHMRRE